MYLIFNAIVTLIININIFNIKFLQIDYSFFIEIIIKSLSK